MAKKPTGTLGELTAAKASEPTRNPEAVDMYQKMTGHALPEMTVGTTADLKIPAEQFVKIDENDAHKERMAEAQGHREERINGVAELIADATQQEAARVAELDQKLATDETYGKTEDEMRTASAMKSNNISISSDPPSFTYNEGDYMPTYASDTQDNQDDAPAKVATKDDESDENLSDGEKLAKHLREIPTTNIEHDEKSDKLVHILRDRTAHVEDIKRKSPKDVGDVAFLNAINQFKQQNFRTNTVPLINSGFFADVTGIGAVDLTMLYDSANENSSPIDYELEKMQVAIKNIVETRPKIPAQILRSRIHYNDYPLLMYAIICGTLNEIYTVQPCSECEKDFKVSAAPNTLLLNKDELLARMVEINNASSVDDVSLMSKDKKITTKAGFEVTIGHPSFIDMINMFNMMKLYSQKLSPIEAGRLGKMSETLSMVRAVYLPNGTKASNIYQMFLALQMMGEEEFKLVIASIKAMLKDIVIPKFGIEEVVCPHCGAVNKNIPYSRLDDMVFFHTMVTQSET